MAWANLPKDAEDELASFGHLLDGLRALREGLTNDPQLTLEKRAECIALLKDAERRTELAMDAAYAASAASMRRELRIADLFVAVFEPGSIVSATFRSIWEALASEA